MVASRPLGSVKPGLQRTSSRAEKEWVGDSRREAEWPPGARGHGHVRPAHTHQRDGGEIGGREGGENTERERERERERVRERERQSE